MPKQNATPATPLPWIENKRTEVIAASDFRTVANCVHVLNAQEDAAYIVLAANEYPRLVAENAKLRDALQQAADDLLDGDYETRSGYSSELRALLSEVSE